MAILGTGAATTKLSQVTPHKVTMKNRTEKLDLGKSWGKGLKMGGGEGVFMKLTFSEKKLTLVNMNVDGDMCCKINKI